MKAGMLKLTDVASRGDLWVQCAQVTYVKKDIEGEGQRTIVGLTSGEELRVSEAASWVRKQLCPHDEQDD